MRELPIIASIRIIPTTQVLPVVTMILYFGEDRWEQPKTLKELMDIPDDETEIQHVDEILKLLHAVTGDSRYEEILVSSKGKVKNMCEVAERLENIGRAEGLAEDRTKLIQDMLKHCRTPEEIAVFSGLSDGRVRTFSWSSSHAFFQFFQNCHNIWLCRCKFNTSL